MAGETIIRVLFVEFNVPEVSDYPVFVVEAHPVQPRVPYTGQYIATLIEQVFFSAEVEVIIESIALMGRKRGIFRQVVDFIEARI